jgi:TPR repeat protein
MLLSTPLRCRQCRHRFWVFSPVKPLLLLMAVAAIISVTAWLAFDQDAIKPSSSPVDNSLTHKRASQGDAEAQLQLGLRYAEGDGVIKNSKEAAKWFELAARQGQTEAQYRYGLALMQGRGVVQDYQAAFSWIEKPAQRGYAKAQYSLAELYRYGTGTPADKARAYLWYNLAAAQGVEAAAKARDQIVLQLKPDQVAAMQAEARRISRTAYSSAPATAQAAPAVPPATP